MFFECFKRDTWRLIAVFLCLKGAACFFVKHVETGKCINDTANVIREGGSWGSESDVELVANCLDSASQFRFRDNGAMLNLKRQGCLSARYRGRGSSDKALDMFFIYVDHVSLDRYSCAQDPTRNIYRAITQTSAGGLSQYYQRNSGSSYKYWCIEPKTYSELADIGLDPYIGATTPCNSSQNQIFNFGVVTCYGNKVENANCPKGQTMVVKTASYRGLPDSKTCGLSDDYTCEVDVTCFVKRHCDGQHESNLTVNDSSIPVEACPGLSKYLYFEYRCVVDKSPLFKVVCVHNVSLSNSLRPNQGVIQITTDDGTKNVCWQSLKNDNNAKNVVCRQLGYQAKHNLIESTNSSDTKHAIFLGTIQCSGDETMLSQCLVKNGGGPCTLVSHIKCFICARPHLENKDRIPDSSFTASATPTQGHSASDARISSGSSWCAPGSEDKPYLQLDLQRRYLVNSVATFGDSSSAKWVTSYHLNYSLDLTNWKPALSGNKMIFEGNKNAYNHVARRVLNASITTRALRFIPITFVVQACMRIEICGYTLLPDEPTNLTVTNIKSRSVKLSWSKPQNEGKGSVSRFWIKLKKDNVDKIVHNVITGDVLEYKIKNLAPYTAYEISIAAGNEHGFGKEIDASFTTSEEAPDGPPLDVKAQAESASSLAVTWKPPEEDKRNGEIVSYTVCISHSKNQTCFKNYTTEEQKLEIKNLNVSTKYYVRVLASNNAGSGDFSESKGAFTYGKDPGKPTNTTESTLTFSLEIPTRDFTYFYVVALELAEGEHPTKTPDSYRNDELVTYAEATASSSPKPYIAAVLTASGTKGAYMFILGDRSNTSTPTTRRRRSASSDYHNGPLQSGTNYSIFQRIVINDQGDYYSTEWSPTSTTVKTPPSVGSGDGGDGGGNHAAIIGAVVGVCVVLILVILVIIIVRKRRGNQDSKSGIPQDIHVDRHTNASPIANEAFMASNVSVEEQEQNANIDEQDGVRVEQNIKKNGDENMGKNVEKNTEKNGEKSTDVPNLYANVEVAVAQTHEPVPVEEFSDHVNYLRQNDKKVFKLEFEDLPTDRILDWDISKRSFNTAKNRYGNAVTYNHSRVVLSGGEKRDYINASYINGLTEKYYIATQGPKEKTVNDFWRMIFEHKCPTIVMLTTLKEMGKVKCEKYWPDESGMYGEIKVTAKKSRTFADYVTRTFMLEKGGEHHGVQQFHFKSWPDYGVPLYPTQILTFRRHFKSFHETKAGPAVIHCSAGVGRTGVFIAVDKILDGLDKNNDTTIDVFGFVQDMRTRRVNMVQTSDQYVFIHDAIVDHTKCGANEVEAAKVMFEIKHLSEKNKKGEAGFEEKFKRLNAVSPRLLKEQCEAALLEENRKKNRKAGIYPTESARPYLSHVENVENSDYINACYVDGYLGRNYFIATQTPLKETINDFWRMAFQHNSSTIVMLNQLREDDEEYQMFWPTQRAKPQSFGPSTVMLDSFSKKDNIVLRKFIVSPSADLRGGRIIQMIHLISWPDHGVPQNVDDIVKLLSEVDESQRAAEKKGPVIVICSDGAGRTGTYIAISNLVDRVKLVQVIDVFQCIKLIRARRPQFVETVAQFKLCYDAVASVLKSYNEYSNFNVSEA